MERRRASRLDKVEPPATIAAGERARQLSRQGRDIIDLGQSSPHHITPEHIIEAGVKALRDGMTNIESPRGFRNSARRWQKTGQAQRLDVNPGGDVLVTPGSKQGFTTPSTPSSARVTRSC